MGKKIFQGKSVLIEGQLGPATILAEDGVITKICREYHPDKWADFGDVVDAGHLVLMPGVIDSHVHVNEPGRTDWEGYETATKAAAAGGITTIVDMPLNSIPPTTTVENFKEKLRAAHGKCFVDVAFWGGLVPGNVGELEKLISMGVVGFKCFLVNSGVEEFQNVHQEHVLAAMDVMKGTGSVLLFHAEFEPDHVPNTDGLNPRNYSTFLESRPSDMENNAISFIAQACLQKDVRCHIVHLGSGDAIPTVSNAKKVGAPLTVETCHHYLTWKAEEIPDGATQFKCCPPIRDTSHQEALWSAVKEGLIDLVVSDHSPCTPDLKLLDKGDFLAAWGGISSVQFGLSLFWTGAQSRGLSIGDVSKYLSQGPAKLIGMFDRKGSIREGLDADFVIWDPQASFIVKEEDIQHKNKVTPYLGKKLKGVVKQTILRGETIFTSESKLASDPKGQHLFKVQG